MHASFAFRGLRLAALLLAAGAALPTAHADWTYNGGNLNAAQTYDGAGVDSALDPHVQGGAGTNCYIGIGGTGSITVASGSLTLDSNDFKVGRNANSNGTIAVQTGASLTINQINQWGGGVGVNNNNTSGVTGSVTVGEGATFDWFLSGTNEQNFNLGNGGNDAGTGGNGLNTSGTITINGGTFHLTLDETQAVTATAAGFNIGRGAGTGTVRLNSGTFRVTGNLPVAVGGRWIDMTTTPVFVDNPLGLGKIEIVDGHFVSAGSSLFEVGSGDQINFIVGGTGSLSIVGWNETQFQALIDGGKIAVNGVAVEAGNYSQFTFQEQDGLGVYQLIDATGPPAILTDPVNQDVLVGQQVEFSVEVAGAPAPTVQWQKSIDFGDTWTDIPGAEGTTFLLDPVSYADSGDYRAVATNSEGTAESASAWLFVTYPEPSVTLSPAATTVVSPGATVALEANASGLGTLTYQWFFEGALLAETSATLTLTDFQPEDEGLYTVIVEDDAGLSDIGASAFAETSVHLLLAEPATKAVGLNFSGDGNGGSGSSNQAGTLDTFEQAGFLPTSGWNNTQKDAANPASPIELLDSDGDPSGVTAIWTSTNTWDVGGTAAAKTPDGRLLHGYIEADNNAATDDAAVVTLNGVTYTEYDVYVFTSGDTAGATGSVIVNGNESGRLFYKSAGRPTEPPSFSVSTATTAGDAQESSTPPANFVRFRGLTGTSLTIALSKVSGNPGGISGIQIVNTGVEAPATAPADLVATGGEGSAELSWTAVAEATSYTVYRSDFTGGPYTAIATGVTLTSYTDPFPSGGTFYYVVKAVNAGGSSADYSNEATAVISAGGSLLEIWREANFGSAANSGDAADDADPDNDGRSNLLEYALGTDPNLPGTGPLVELGESEGKVTLTFDRIADPALFYEVHASGDLADWSELVFSSTGEANTAGAVLVIDTQAITAATQRFLRLQVRY